MKYKSEPIAFEAAGEKLYVRAKATHAIIPEVGTKVNLPEWLEQQAQAIKELEEAKKKKVAAPRLAYLESKIVFPGILERYMETGSTSRLWEVQKDKKAFQSETLTEAQQRESAMNAEAAEKDAKIAALEAQLEELKQR